MKIISYIILPNTILAENTIEHRMIKKMIPNIDRGYHAAFRVEDSIETLRLNRRSLINFKVTKKTMSDTMYVYVRSQYDANWKLINACGFFVGSRFSSSLARTS